MDPEPGGAEPVAPRADSRTVLGLKLLAPYFAVIPFWLVLGSGWLAILAYHAQALLWARGAWPNLRKPKPSPLIWFVVPSALAGPVMYVLLPYITRTDLATWLVAHGLGRTSLLAMVAYFGIVHPFIEQMHWSPLRERTLWAHVAFAGYHVLVLYSLLTIPWLIVSFVVLLVASMGWQRMERETGSPTIPVTSHVLADLGIIVAALLRAFGI